MNNRLIAAVLLSPLIAGCGTLWYGDEMRMRQGTSSSLVEFLYPDGRTPPERDGKLPLLNLPLDVGLAFVPSNQLESISAAEKQELLERVADAFRDRPFVSSIEVVPEAYLSRAEGLRGLRQVASVFGVDAMALVSYDQLSLSGERDSAILYWTIVGMLVVKGNRNEVHTMTDTAVFDVASGKLLFRAPGIHRNGQNSTFTDNARELRKLRVDGFSNATDDMITNLNVELEELRAAAREGERVQLAWRDGKGGGGSTGVIMILILAGVALMRLAPLGNAGSSGAHRQRRVNWRR